MKFLQIGLGSMGKRRIRCLKSLGHKNILAYDIKDDRRREAETKYRIQTTGDLDRIDYRGIDAILISTPPDKHAPYIRLAIDQKKPAFVEASVILAGLERLNSQAKKRGVLIAPSCTLKFHFAIKEIKALVAGGAYGKMTNFSYHSGQYLPDWHPWERIRDYYVGRKETGGGREIVPFELTWLVDIAGWPKSVTGLFGKTMRLGVDIDDTYVIGLDFGRAFGSLIVDVVSRYATRSLILNMEFGQILWRWDEPEVKIYDARNLRWIHHHCPQGQSAAGYNKNITEDMYIDEVRSFVAAATGKGTFPNTLGDDIKVLKILEQVEILRRSKQEKQDA